MEGKKEERKCELCKDKATTICYDCSFYLCDGCFKFLHEKEANKEHKKEDIDPFFTIDIKCHEHPKIPMSLFCAEESSKNAIYYLFFINI